MVERFQLGDEVDVRFRAVVNDRHKDSAGRYYLARECGEGEVPNSDGVRYVYIPPSFCTVVTRSGKAEQVREEKRMDKQTTFEIDDIVEFDGKYGKLVGKITYLSSNSNRVNVYLGEVDDRNSIRGSINVTRDTDKLRLVERPIKVGDWVEYNYHRSQVVGIMFKIEGLNCYLSVAGSSSLVEVNISFCTKIPIPELSGQPGE